MLLFFPSLFCFVSSELLIELLLTSKLALLLLCGCWWNTLKLVSVNATRNSLMATHKCDLVTTFKQDLRIFVCIGCLVPWKYLTEIVYNLKTLWFKKFLNFTVILSLLLFFAPALILKTCTPLVRRGTIPIRGCIISDYLFREAVIKPECSFITSGNLIKCPNKLKRNQQNATSLASDEIAARCVCSLTAACYHHRCNITD